MSEEKSKDFFDIMRRSVKMSYVISSLFPLLVMIYIFYTYISPNTDEQTKGYIQILLAFVVIISVLGLVVMSRVTNQSIFSAQNLQEKLNSLIDISKQFRETLYVDILLESIVKSAMHLNSAESGSLLLYDDLGDLRFKVLVGDRGEKIKNRAVKQGVGITGWVAAKGESAIINDITKDDRFSSEFDKESGYKTRSIMCVPLVHDKKVIGVIEVLNKTTGYFTAEDEKLLFSLADQASISIAQSRTFESRHSDLIHITEILVSAQDFHTPRKVGHARRVASYATLIGKIFDLSEGDLKHIYYASLLHDLGFLKMDREDQANMEKVKHHPELGYEMIKSVSIWKEAAEILLGHHERYDGTGYPLGKKGLDILLGSRILAVAGTFDVITSEHSYKEKIDYGAAIKEIEANAGTQFDPEVVKALKTAIKDSDLIED